MMRVGSSCATSIEPSGPSGPTIPSSFCDRLGSGPGPATCSPRSSGSTAPPWTSTSSSSVCVVPGHLTAPSRGTVGCSSTSIRFDPRTPVRPPTNWPKPRSAPKVSAIGCQRAAGRCR
ncbi:MAG: hypothetical protein MZV65_42960 [Chromatiales bacterium]|nr:hypothetical protein [Chromatiales bacterium]